MDANAFYYTYSTICQTLAGAFGFLVAVVLYQMQNLIRGMRAKLNQFKGRLTETDESILAEQSDAWSELSNWAKAQSLKKVEEHRQTTMKIELARTLFMIDCRKLDSLKRDLIRSSKATALSIGSSLLLLPFSEYFAGRFILGTLLLLGPVLMSLWCIYTYIRLTWNVVLGAEQRPLLKAIADFFRRSPIQR